MWVLSYTLDLANEIPPASPSAGHSCTQDGTSTR
jgi:hypothetical protein